MIVLGGDFRQVLPVVQKGTRAAIVAASLSNSDLWQCLTRMQLSTNMRVQLLQQSGQDAGQQQRFAQLLLAVGEGRAGDPFPIPTSMLASSTDPKDLISSIFGDLGGSDAAAAAVSAAAVRSRELLISRAILTPLNKDVDALNDQVLASFPGDAGCAVGNGGHVCRVSVAYPCPVTQLPALLPRTSLSCCTPTCSLHCQVS